MRAKWYCPVLDVVFKEICSAMQYYCATRNVERDAPL